IVAEEREDVGRALQSLGIAGQALVNAPVDLVPEARLWNPIAKVAQQRRLFDDDGEDVALEGRRQDRARAVPGDGELARPEVRAVGKKTAVPQVVHVQVK